MRLARALQVMAVLQFLLCVFHLVYTPRNQGLHLVAAAASLGPWEMGTARAERARRGKL